MDQVSVELRQSDDVTSDVLGIPVLEDDDTATVDASGALDERLAERLRRLAEKGELRGELGKTLVLHTDGDVKADHVVAAGLGPRDEADADAVRTAAAS